MPTIESRQILRSSQCVYVEEVASGSAPIVGVGTSVAAFIGEFDDISGSDGIVAPGEIHVCTNFGELKKFFSDFPVREESIGYINCDAETNPPEVLDLGQVITETSSCQTCRICDFPYQSMDECRVINCLIRKTKLSALCV